MLDYTSDEDLDEWIRQQASMPYSDDPPPSAAPAQPQARDPYAEYMQLRGQMPQQNAQPMPQMPEQDYTGYLGAAGGAILDGILNKGRGVGQIAAATASNYGQDVNRRRQMEFELQKAQALQRNKHDPLDSYMEYARIVNGQESNARQLDALGLRKDLVNPDSVAAQGKVQQLGAEAGSKTANSLDARIERAPQLADAAGQRAEQNVLGKERGEQQIDQTKLERNVRSAQAMEEGVGPIRNQNAVAREKELAPLRTDAAVDRAGQLAPIQRDLAKGKADDMTAELGERGQDRQALAATAPLTAAQNQAQINEFNKSNKDTMELASALRDLGPLIYDEKGGRREGLPIGPIDSGLADFKEYIGATDPEDAKIATGLLKARTYLQHYVTGAASATAEEKRLAALAADPHVSDERFYAAIEDLSKSTKAKLAAAMTGREGAIGPVLKNAGLDTWAGIQPAAPSAPAAPLARETPADDGIETNTAGVQTGGGNYFAKNPDGSYTVWEDGQEAQDGIQLKPAQLQFLISKGFREQ